MFAPTSRFEAEKRVSPPLPRSFGAVDLEFRNKARRHPRPPHVSGGRDAGALSQCEGAPEAVLINTAGGLTGGDCVTMGVEMGEGTSAIVTTQAHEKVYKSSGGTVSIIASLKLGAGVTLEWLPQPTILFDRAMLARETACRDGGRRRFSGRGGGDLRPHRHGRGDEDRRAVRSLDASAATAGWSMPTVSRWTARSPPALSKVSVLAGNAAMATIRHVCRPCGGEAGTRPRGAGAKMARPAPGTACCWPVS